MAAKKNEADLTERNQVPPQYRKIIEKILNTDLSRMEYGGISFHKKHRFQVYSQDFRDLGEIKSPMLETRRYSNIKWNIFLDLEKSGEFKERLTKLIEDSRINQMERYKKILQELCKVDRNKILLKRVKVRGEKRYRHRFIVPKELMPANSEMYFKVPSCYIRSYHFKGELTMIFDLKHCRRDIKPRLKSLIKDMIERSEKKVNLYLEKILEAPLDKMEYEGRPPAGVMSSSNETIRIDKEYHPLLKKSRAYHLCPQDSRSKNGNSIRLTLNRKRCGKYSKEVGGMLDELRKKAEERADMYLRMLCDLDSSKIEVEGSRYDPRVGSPWVTPCWQVLSASKRDLPNLSEINLDEEDGFIRIISTSNGWEIMLQNEIKGGNTQGLQFPGEMETKMKLEKLLNLLEKRQQGKIESYLEKILPLDTSQISEFKHVVPDPSSEAVYDKVIFVIPFKIVPIMEHKINMRYSSLRVSGDGEKTTLVFEKLDGFLRMTDSETKKRFEDLVKRLNAKFKESV